MASKKNLDRVKEIYNKYKSEIDPVLKKYEDLCKKHDKEPKDILHTASFFKNVEHIGVSSITDVIENQMNNEFEDEMKEERTTKKRKLEEKEESKNPGRVCSCGNKKFFVISSRAHDGNYATLPEEKSLDIFQTFPVYVRAMITVCIQCGKLFGFDPVICRKELDDCEERYL